MSRKEQGLSRRTFSLSDVNGLFLIAGVLATTILMAGVSEARYHQVAIDIAKAKEFKLKKEMKLAHCPLGQYSKNTVVR